MRFSNAAKKEGRNKEGFARTDQSRGIVGYYTRSSCAISNLIQQGSLVYDGPWGVCGGPVCAATMQVKKIFSSWRRVEDRQAKLTKYPCTTFIFAEVEGKDVIRKEEGTF